MLTPCFCAQHMGGGLLDKTDAAIKSELESLLPLQVWAELRSEAASLAATARDEAAAVR